MEIVATQDFDAWFEDYVKDVIAEPAPLLPSFKQKIGSSVAHWFECAPGLAHIYAEGGTSTDKYLAEIVVREQLIPRGVRRASYTLRWDKSDSQLMKESKWEDIEAGAKRLIENGKVQILRNGQNVVVGHVEGDHGDYTSEFNRDDPNSGSITMWHCDCPWDQFAWQRTRQWKKYEGRVCKHVLALYWESLKTPIDEENEPAGGEPSPFTPQPSVPGGSVPPPGSAGVPGEQQRTFYPNVQEEQVAPGSQAPAPPGISPNPAELIPQFPYDPAMQPAVNPVSVPGLKPQTPLNPVQNAGGTFSHVYSAEGDTFVNGEIVSNLNEDIGVTVGLNAGAQQSIPVNSVGEVLGTDPTTGMVNVYFAGPASSNTFLEPHGVTGWFFPNELTKRTDVRAPGPAVRRRRSK